jgi:quinoprotein glucose dehydrogenase
MTPKPVIPVVLLGAALTVTLSAQRAAPPAGATNVEWRAYGGDLRHQHYSPLAQIDAGNFNSLEVPGGSKPIASARARVQAEGTPLEINGILYTTAGTRRAVVALDAATGRIALGPCGI